MDNLPGFLTANLPPSLLAHLTSHSSTYWRLYSSALAARDQTLRLVGPAWASLRNLNPDLTSLVLLAVLLLLALKVLDMLRAAVMFWLRLAYRLAVWGGLALLGLWVWTRGLEGAAEDTRQAVAWMSAHWNESYRQYQQQEELARMAQRLTRQQGGGGGGGWFGR